MLNVAESSLGKVKLEPLLTAAVHGGHVGGGGVCIYRLCCRGLWIAFQLCFCVLFACLACHS